MKKKEMREMTITYCDYCGKELRYGHSTIQFEDGSEKDFCDEYTENITETCLDKFKKEQILNHPDK